MLATILKQRFRLQALWDSLGNFSMSSSFYGQEIQRALKEQGSLIQSFKVLDAGPLQASARIKLLEGQLIAITLTVQGYRVGLPLSSPVPLLPTHSQVDNNSDGSTSQAYETIEDLLQSASPLYARKRSEAILDALKRLS